MSFQPLIKTFKLRNQHFDLTYSYRVTRYRPSSIPRHSSLKGIPRLTPAVSLANSRGSLIFFKQRKQQGCRRITACNELILSAYSLLENIIRIISKTIFLFNFPFLVKQNHLSQILHKIHGHIIILLLPIYIAP